MDSSQIAERNLARLRPRHPELARALETAGPDGLEVVTGPRGAVTLASGGVLLASAYDPEREGERLAEQMCEQPADVMIAIGFGLAYHLEAYRRRAAGPLVVFEPSPARLRAALSVRPGLGFLSQQDVWITHDPEQLGRIVGGLYAPGLRLGVFVHPSAWRLAPAQVREAVQRLGRVKDTSDVTAATRVKLLETWTRASIENVPRLLRTPSFSALRGTFVGAPAVVAAAGPSLDKQLPALAEVADRVLVLAVGPSLGALRAHDIEPDLVHVLESSDVAHQLTRAGSTESLQLVLTPKVHPQLFELPVRARFVAYTASERLVGWLAQQLGEEQLVEGAGSVALGAVHLAALLGANPILLVGQDLAFTGGRVYASGSCYEKIGFDVDADAFRYTNMEQRLEVYGGDRRRMQQVVQQRLVQVEGWDGQPVPTSLSYASFIEYYREIGRTLATRGVRVVNCTEGGARIAGLEHASFSDALAACSLRPLDARRRIQQAFDAAEPHDPAPLRGALRRARRAMKRIEAAARKGLREVRSAPGRLARSRSPQQQVSVLRRIGRSERELRRELAATPWLEAFVQAELHEAAALLHRASRASPTPAEVVEECALLLRGTLSGIERARPLFERLETLVFDEDAAGD